MLAPHTSFQKKKIVKIFKVTLTTFTGKKKNYFDLQNLDTNIPKLINKPNPNNYLYNN